MGRQARCTVEWQGKKHTAALHLDSRHIDVRIKPSLRVAFERVRSVEIAGARLILALAEGPLVLHLGDDAPVWAEKIQNPRSRLQKLGIKPGARVCLIDFEDAEFAAELHAAGVESAHKLGRAETLVFLYVAEPGELDALARIRKALAPEGAVWVLREKGKTAKVSEDEVRKRAKQAGLVDVKVLAFSNALSGLRLVIPVAKR